MDRVVEALKATNYTQIAKKSGTTPAYISLLFNRRRGGKLDTVKKVATALGVSLDELHSYLSRSPKEKRPWTAKTTPASAPGNRVKPRRQSKAPATAAA